ncbi:DUF1129 domain-containing protein [Melissococcus plutonius]|uniref:DUF1129 domain-containing protein n=1 Tax=Melissococcus plutonius TaxID=33970 RepID=UPI003C2CA2E8
METETAQEMHTENQELEKKLTKKNAQYIFDFKKSMQTANISEQEQVEILNEMFIILIEEQKTGRTARQLFGTVSERTEAILNKPKVQKPVNGWLLWADNSLLLLGMLAIMVFVMTFISKNNSQTLGILTLFVGSAVGGYVFYLLSKMQINRINGKATRYSGLKTGVITMFGMLAWIVIFVGSSLLPPVINPSLDPFVAVIIGGITLAGRYGLKKKYNIKGSFMTRPNQS